MKTITTRVDTPSESNVKTRVQRKMGNLTGNQFLHKNTESSKYQKNKYEIEKMLTLCSDNQNKENTTK